MIGTQPKGAAGVLDDPDLDPFWEAASRRKATLFVHPTFGARDDRLRAYGLVSAVGRVTDTSIAMSRLLYSGHLTRYPGVNLVISHGGAALADGARPAAPQLCDRAGAERRSDGRLPPALISTASSTTRRRCASSATWPATTKS